MTDNPSPTLLVGLRDAWLTLLGVASDVDNIEHGSRVGDAVKILTAFIAAKDARIADLERERDGLLNPVSQEFIDCFDRGIYSTDSQWKQALVHYWPRLVGALARQAEQLEQMRSRIVTAQGGIFEDIAKERERQEQLLVERGWKWSMATPGIDHALKLMPLMEEVGEVAHAVRVAEGFAVAGNSHENHGLYAELKQVAACAVAWMEALNAEENERAALSPNEPAPEFA